MQPENIKNVRPYSSKGYWGMSRMHRKLLFLLWLLAGCRLRASHADCFYAPVSRFSGLQTEDEG